MISKVLKLIILYVGLENNYILLGTFFWNRGWYSYEFESIWRAFGRVKYGKTSKSIYILLGAFFWNTGWYFLRVLTVFDEPLGE